MQIMKNYNKALQDLYDHVGFKEDEEGNWYWCSRCGDNFCIYNEADTSNKGFTTNTFIEVKD